MTSRFRTALLLVPRLEELFAFALGASLVRQALWLVPGTAVPLLASALGGAVAAVVVRRSAASRPTPPRLFWLVVALPILVLWALRAPLPDLGYDTLNYHLMHGQKAWLGPLFPPGDFYPYYFPFLNPAGDMVTALFRFVLGYRGGTVASALALVWTGEVLWRLLSPVLKGERVRAAAVLAAIATEGTLWEVSGYMVDLLPLPILLEAMAVTLSPPPEAGRLTRRSAVLGLLLGTAVALKLTNLVFALPIGLVALVRWRSGFGSIRPAIAALGAGALAFLLPVAPHALVLTLRHGNPVFPHFNARFESPDFPPLDIKDLRWGPVSARDALAWTVTSAFRPERLSEFMLTTGRLALGWVVALGALLFVRRDGLVRAIAFVAVAGGVLWSFGTGYYRYGLFGELAGSLAVILVAARLAGSSGPRSTTASRLPWTPARAAAAVLAVVLAAQTGRSFFLALRSDWSGRPTVLHALRDSSREMRHVLADRDLASFLPPEWESTLAAEPVWVDATPKVNGIMTFLSPRSPMIGLQMEDLLAVSPNLARLDDALRACAGRPAFSLAFAEDAARAEERLFRLGFPVLGRTPLSFPFFSDERRIDLVLFSVALPPPLATASSTSGPSPWKVGAPLLGSLDGPVEGQVVTGDLLVRGWAREPGEDLRVSILVDGAEVRPREFRRVPRPDVPRVFPDVGDCRWAGYEAIVERPAGAKPEPVVSVVFRSRDGRSRHYPGVRIRWSDGGPVARR
ncbi:MAG TPA: hypothetical protein PLL76_22140 [Thermoanaerobaculia bacterium]|nr:hypothetical protein [Thermoanaerobaculia bacterium]